MNKHFLNKQIIRCKDTKEVCKGYQAYLNSTHWKRLREKILNECDYTCQRCGEKKPRFMLQIHHRNYENVGNEERKDILLVCEECHRKEHFKKKYIRQTKKRINPAKLNKWYCKYNDVGNCSKFSCRCFDCKEYKKNDDYIK